MMAFQHNQPDESAPGDRLCNQFRVTLVSHNELPGNTDGDFCALQASGGIFDLHVDR